MNLFRCVPAKKWWHINFHSWQSIGYDKFWGSTLTECTKCGRMYVERVGP